MKKEIICGIYKITSPSDKIYIGQSKNINRRLGEHRNNKHRSQPKLYKSIIKYGWEAHRFEIIHICLETELNYLERYYIKLYNTFNSKHGLNLTEGGDYTKMSEETKEKMKLTRQLNNAWIGRKHSEESKLKMSVSAKGNSAHLGKPHSEEVKKKLSNINKNRKISEETKAKIIKGLIGRKLTEETKKKISESHKKNKRNVGRVTSKETKEKIMIANKGRKRSPESCERIRIANIGKFHSESTKIKIGEAFSKNYEIYNQNNELQFKFKGNIRLKLKELGLPRERLCDTYRKNKEIKNGIYRGWYIIKS